MPLGSSQGEPAVVLLSGGLDSAVALAAMKRDGYACHALSFDYGQRHRHELAASERVASQLGAVDHRTVAVDLRAVGGSALTDQGIPVPKDRTSAGRESSGEIPVTYVPARNLIFLSIAVGLAETIGSRHIAYGANSMDYSGYPDCRWPFIDAFIRAANLGTKAGVSLCPTGAAGFAVHAPLIKLTKAQIIRLGGTLGVDFSLTHSCYDPDASGRACGHCDSCLIRRRGFTEAGVPDPTRYVAAAVAL